MGNGRTAKGRCEVSKASIANYVNDRLMGIQQNGAKKADELNFPVRSPDISGDLLKNCPYPGNSIEALAWSAGYWSMVAGILNGDMERMIRNETR